jgi:protein-L-isoaspartate(D-aspartate) O-methyltransferase
MDADTARAAFAAELRYVANIRSRPVVEAFAAVRREDFLGPKPWKVANMEGGYWHAPVDDPGAAYHNVLFAIDADRELNNGQPEFWARLLDRLDVRPGDRLYHVGAGTGYYTAIMAELVGSAGSVIAIEIDPGLAERARMNLSTMSHVEVVCGDGAAFDPGPVDVVVINAGATHPMPIWLTSLRPGGRLLVPLTADSGRGSVFRIDRLPPLGGFSAKIVSGVGIFPCAGARARDAEATLANVLAGGGQRFVRSLRCDPHVRDETCWLHGDGFCFSTCAPA